MPDARRSRAHDRLRSEILVALGSRPDVRVWLIESKQAFRPDGTPFRAVPLGEPDIAGVIAPSGRHLAIEVKTGTGRASEAQTARLTMYRAFGAVAGVARTLDQAVRAVEAAIRGEWVPGPGLEL